MRRMPGWIKRGERQATYVTASVRFADGKTTPVIITDISSDGCKVSCRRMLRIGEVVDLNVPGRMTFKAGVRWWTPGRAGLLFIGVSGDGVRAIAPAADNDPVEVSDAV